MEWLPWVIVAVLAIALIAVLVMLAKAKKEANHYRGEHGNVSDRLEKQKNYYVDSSDRLALATFCADHLDDMTHPHRQDVVRILAQWGATGENRGGSSE